MFVVDNDNGECYLCRGQALFIGLGLRELSVALENKGGAVGNRGRSELGRTKSSPVSSRLSCKQGHVIQILRKRCGAYVCNLYSVIAVQYIAACEVNTVQSCKVEG